MNPYFNPDSPISGKFYQVIATPDKVRFITFDDWGSDKTITKILNILEKYNVKASFFIRASGAENNPNLLKAIDEAGHDIACHTYSHSENYIASGTEFIQKDLVACYQILTEAIGHQPRLYFRFPRHENNKQAINTVLATGFTDIIQGSIRPEDYAISKEKVLRNISSFEEKYSENGHILVLHLTDNASGADALSQIIEHFRARGYKLTKLSEYVPER